MVQSSFLFGAFKFPRGTYLGWLESDAPVNDACYGLHRAGLAFRNQDAYWGLRKIGASVMGRMPFCRGLLNFVHLMLGGPIIAGGRLSHGFFFAIHVFIIPGTLIGPLSACICSWCSKNWGINEWPVPGPASSKRENLP